MEFLRSRQALHVLHRHRETFLSKQDFQAIHDMGLNSVRVPFGYWVVLGPSAGEPYEGPALDMLDKAVQWAEECHLEVLLDLHGCPGGESADAPCGHRQRPESKWVWQQWRRLETLKALEVVARRYRDRKCVTGIAVCNEPSRLIPAEILASFYDEAVDVVRAAGMTDRVTVVLPVFQRCLRTFEALWRQISKGRHRNTCFDVHHYHCFEDAWNRMTLAEHLRAVEDHGREFQEFPLVVGEWSLALGGRAASAMCPREAMNLFARAQLNAYSQASHGWFFWNWRDGAGPAWDFRSSFLQGLLEGAAPILPTWNGLGEDPLERLLEPTVGDPYVRYGHAVCLRSWNGRCVDVEKSKVSARWFEGGDWQTFLICPAASSAGCSGAVRDGDVVRLLAHSGVSLGVSTSGKVLCRPGRSINCELTVLLKANPGCHRQLRHKDQIYLQCRTSGRVLDVEGSRVAARFQHFGEWQSLSIERKLLRDANSKGGFMEDSMQSSDFLEEVMPSLKRSAAVADLVVPSPVRTRLTGSQARVGLAAKVEG
ncbi:exgA [Symbiodinium pilosum]|uniref:glucan 1,3-beta-glucosidase n=1 Tax=Symbiodinium pilosum TaxID=2952 RepID=A0A812SSU0_SYMPI|nr:exgA [Symbiodinium pilosum]